MTGKRALDSLARAAGNSKRVVDFDLRQPDDGIVHGVVAARRRGNGVLVQLDPPHLQCGCKSAKHSAGGCSHHVINWQWKWRQRVELVVRRYRTVYAHLHPLARWKRRPAVDATNTIDVNRGDVERRFAHGFMNARTFCS